MINGELILQGETHLNTAPRHFSSKINSKVFFTFESEDEILLCVDPLCQYLHIMSCCSVVQFCLKKWKSMSFFYTDYCYFYLHLGDQRG